MTSAHLHRQLRRYSSGELPGPLNLSNEVRPPWNKPTFTVRGMTLVLIDVPIYHTRRAFRKSEKAT